MKNLAIGPGTSVTLHFELKLSDGTVVDSNFEKDPATFTVGDGNLLQGFEESLLGLSAGDKNTAVVPPEKGFGQHNPNNIQKIGREQFPDDVKLEQGLMLSFADAQQTELPGVVTDITDKSVTVDFNHPLAGRSIHFSVQIIDVSPAVTH